ncbi:ABC transporter ATP-binding protein [Tengunoibacter tsumagoiensis]|uniref:Helicase n=1 Tax=Tengunoibacter tsumagoiensis TaxID=2014871 RepID=A0A401ZYQ5_9CHLR|nr:ABC transporter ATP-binding protein [Tengunoibacter tsumagoiensis]GCE11970.1 helicase [Tengunoibacter tsumagoiensis]
MKVTAKRYWQFLRIYVIAPQWPRVLLLAVLLICLISLRILNPLVLGAFINMVGHTSLRTLMNQGILFLCIAFAQQIVGLIEAYVAENTAWIATNKLRSALTYHCLNLDFTFHHQHTPGELIERIDGDVNMLRNFFSRFVVSLLGNILLVCGVLLYLLTIDWRLGLFLTICTIGVLYALMRVRNIGVPFWRNVRQATSDFFGFLEEHLVGTEELKANGAVSYALQRFYFYARTIRRATWRAEAITTVTNSTSRFLFVISTGLSFAMILYLFSHHLIDVGTAYIIYRLTDMVIRPKEEINRQLLDFQQATVGLERIVLLLDRSNTIADGDMPLHLSTAPSLAFEHVNFSYAETVPVLQDVTFQLPAGKALGIVGRTGSGKTTVTRLLFRLYVPISGTIRIGDHDLRTIKQADICQAIGLVTQEVQLFHATVRDNLTLFNPTIPDQHLIQAITEVGLGPWLLSLPQGLDTLLTPQGDGLSAGEAQLLALVRVFVKNVQVVILDEASSRLDPATEHSLDQAFAHLLAGRTTIVIAHHLKTLEQVDFVLILEKGMIREFGARETLAKEPTSYFNSLRRTGLEEVLA